MPNLYGHLYSQMSQVVGLVDSSLGSFERCKENKPISKFLDFCLKFYYFFNTD